MVCHSLVQSTCPTAPPVAVKCDPATDCPTVPVPEPVICTDTVTWQCAYRWQLPCNADADCGAGFACKPTEVGMCSGSTGPATTSSGGTASAGAGGASGGGGIATPPDVDAGAGTPVTCTVVTSYPGSCTAKVASCTTDSDCPSTWTCVGENQGPAVATSAPVPVDGGIPVAIPLPVVADAGVPGTSTVATKTCQAPTTYGTGSGNPTLDGDPTHKGGTASLSADAGAATGTNTPPSPTTPGATNSGPAQTAASTSGGGGCNVAPGESIASSAWLLLALLGLLVARRERRG
jgi:MYXO-CTERM domain-containing protein